MKHSPVYLRDLRKDCQTDAFLGKGTEKLALLAAETDSEVIVGYYLSKPILMK